jgi:NAD kinase
MQRIERKFVFVTRRTRLEEVIARNSTRSQARFRVTMAGGDWSDLEDENTNYERTLHALRTRLGELARVVSIERQYLPTHVFGPQDVIVCVGQDGLVANCLKYTNGQYVMGINPDPVRFDGILLGWHGRNIDQIVADAERALDSKILARNVSMAEARLSDNQVLRAVNDLFIGLRDHGSSRYQIVQGDRRERQSSSGVIVATGLGSTGWLKSIITTAASVSAFLGGTAAPSGRTVKLDWDSRQLVYSVREAFPSKWTQTGIVFGKITADNPLIIESENPENSIIFSDGIQKDALEFNAPLKAEITLSSVTGRIAWPKA